MYVGIVGPPSQACILAAAMHMKILSTVSKALSTGLEQRLQRLLLLPWACIVAHIVQAVVTMLMPMTMKNK